MIIEKNYYNHLVSCFAGEANKYNLPIFFEYRLKGSFITDIYLPKGLPSLNVTEPTVIEIKNSVNNFSLKRLALIVSYAAEIKYLFVISKDYQADLFNFKHGNLTVRYLNSDFIDKLFYDYQISKYDELFSSRDNQIQFVVEGDTEETYLNRGLRDTYRNTSNIKTFLIDEKEPQRISDINEKEFKAYLGDEEQTNCALFVGNGVSIPFGSDSWSKMVDNMLDFLVPYHIDDGDHIKKFLSDSSYAITSFAKAMLNSPSNKYNEALRYCIYRKYNPDMHKMISAIKAISEAKYRFRNLPILTYNYDTFIERQFGIDHKGFSLKYSTGEPYDLDDKYSLNNIIINNVVHLHGYSSYILKRTKGIVLTDDDYYKAYMNSSSWVRKIQIKILRDYKCLFVGSSMSDLFQVSLIAEAKQKSKNQRWKCYALMCFKDLTTPEKMRMITYYAQKGIQIIFVNKFEEIPMKIASIFGVSI